MEPLDFDDLPEQALLLLDSAPIIYYLKVIRGSHRDSTLCLKLINLAGCGLR